MNVELNVDGKAIPLNGFTQEFIGNVTTAMVESLHGISPNWKEVVIKVQQE